jgi:hypothetical protein
MNYISWEYHGNIMGISISHMQPMVLVYLATKLGDFGQGQMLVNIRGLPSGKHTKNY